jgi:selenocysteine lyase/cysteine desulfurase
MDAVPKYFLDANANTYGAFLTSRRSNEMIANTRAAMADLFNCTPEEVVFGQNMTTITLGLARAIGRELKPGDEILLTILDHDANYSPWKVLKEKGVVIRTVDIRESDCTDLDDLKSKLNTKRNWSRSATRPTSLARLTNSGDYQARTRSWRDDLCGRGSLRSARSD